MTKETFQQKYILCLTTIFFIALHVLSFIFLRVANEFVLLYVLCVMVGGLMTRLIIFERYCIQKFMSFDQGIHNGTYDIHQGNIMVDPIFIRQYIMVDTIFIREYIMADTIHIREYIMADTIFIREYMMVRYDIESSMIL